MSFYCCVPSLPGRKLVFITKNILFLLMLSLTAFAQKQKVWLDADTGNEMDDVYAIVRLLWANGERDIVGLSSAHFNNADLLAFEKWNQYPTAGLVPVRVSQELNEEILNTMGLRRIPHPLGADRQMGRAWGGYQPRPSAATEEILQVIKNLKPGEKLDIVTLGALTNIASLVALDSTVKSRIRVYSLGGGYDFARQAWNKNEFNVRCDLNAYDFMMNQPDLDWTVMPIHSVIHYRFDRDTIYEKFADSNPVEQLMEKRWRETNPQDKTRVLWDLGLVQAYLLPALAPVRTVPAPPENLRKSVKIFGPVDARAMEEDFWKEVKRNR
jgi:purine nucleosidase